MTNPVLKNLWHILFLSGNVYVLPIGLESNLVHGLSSFYTVFRGDRVGMGSVCLLLGRLLRRILSMSKKYTQRNSVGLVEYFETGKNESIVRSLINMRVDNNNYELTWKVNASSS